MTANPSKFHAAITDFVKALDGARRAHPHLQQAALALAVTHAFRTTGLVGHQVVEAGGDAAARKAAFDAMVPDFDPSTNEKPSPAKELPPLSPAERERGYVVFGDETVVPPSPRKQRALEYVRRQGSGPFTTAGVDDLVAFAEMEIEDNAQTLLGIYGGNPTTAELVKELERRKQSGQIVVIPASLSAPAALRCNDVSAILRQEIAVHTDLSAPGMDTAIAFASAAIVEKAAGR